MMKNCWRCIMWKNEAAWATHGTRATSIKGSPMTTSSHCSEGLWRRSTARKSPRSFPLLADEESESTSCSYHSKLCSRRFNGSRWIHLLLKYNRNMDQYVGCMQEKEMHEKQVVPPRTARSMLTTPVRRQLKLWKFPFLNSRSPCQYKPSFYRLNIETWLILL